MAESKQTRANRDADTGAGLEDVMDNWTSSKEAIADLDREPRNQEGLDKVEPPKEADKTSDPVPNDAELHDEPVRTNRPDGQIAGSLATGAGQHMPLDDEDFGPDGRPSPRVIHDASQKPSPGSPAARQAERRNR